MIDLLIHSKNSDGEYTVEELIDKDLENSIEKNILEATKRN